MPSTYVTTRAHEASLVDRRHVTRSSQERVVKQGLSHRTALGILVATVVVAPSVHAMRGTSTVPRVNAVVVAAPDPGDDSLGGRSGKLRIRIVGPTRDGPIRILERLFGDSAARHPGVYTAADSATGTGFSFISLVPFQEKERGRVGAYKIGFWPGERSRRVANADRPEGFIEVTPGNQDTQVSEHFRLRDFLTHDQEVVWPKYLVLREALVDKLELIMDDLLEHGYAVSHLQVMSGFRTPQYNARGVGRGGRARDSRHQYGDAADVFVDNDEDGRMDDLNHDGRVDLRDTRVVMQAVDRVEAARPELVGGAGLYRATRAHGPFVHVDVRGNRARWGRS
jgi:uncharacterized protein YcbK (DUF882 family)